ncbi:MAG: tetratricopeptide repeat protein [Spirochaetaceae bacterium]|jgi:tetratricopeptide (TPR) repeat protein|nr:tetratricopeptide repeat protein [Spirochaetaceae bacterium]
MIARLTFPAAVLLTALTLFSCSSAPKRPMETYALRNQAVTFQEQGNRSVFLGDTASGEASYAQAWKIAMSIDDNVLLCSISLSRVNAALTAKDSAAAEGFLLAADDFAAASGQQSLSLICTVYRARLLVFTGSAAEALSITETAISALGKDTFNLALAWRTKGEALSLLERWQEAETAFLEAAKLHTKNRYLNEIGQDWYLTAQARSLSGRYEEALSALDSAVTYDRLAENSSGLGMDYYARSVILRKLGRPEEAEAARRRSDDIFTAAGIPNPTLVN